jgi:uncharacterized protein YdeI (BOF family)
MEQLKSGTRPFITTLTLAGVLLFGSLFVACNGGGGPAGTSASKGVGGIEGRATPVRDIVQRPANFIGELVLVVGRTIQQGDDENEFFFTDDTEVILVEFKPKKAPELGEPIRLFGKVEQEDGTLKVITILWRSDAAPTVTPIGEIVANPDAFIGERVTVDGMTVRQYGDDRNEFIFADDTGYIVLDFPSNNIAPLGAPIRATGKVSRGSGSAPEIDVSTWERINLP